MGFADDTHSTVGEERVTSPMSRRCPMSREPVREEAQETKYCDLGCFSHNGGAQGSELCSALLLSYPVALAQQSPQPLGFVTGGRANLSLHLPSVFLQNASTRAVPQNWLSPAVRLALTSCFCTASARGHPQHGQTHWKQKLLPAESPLLPLY